MFFDKLNFWEHFSNARILHFAPEEMLVQSIEARIPAEYIKGDLYPDPKKGIQKIDVTVVGFEDNYFDMIICNHVLEHVSDYKKAMKELFRVMKPGGIGIFQTPYSKLFSYNLEENNINTDSLRSFFYLQNDHVRLYGEKQFFHDLEEVGFILKIVKNSDCFDEKTSVYNGVNKEEDLVQVIKPLPGL